MKNALALRIGFDSLIHDSDDGIGGCGNQSRFLVHANVLDIFQMQIRKVDSVGSDLFGQQDVGDFVEAAFFVDRIPVAIDQALR